MTDSKIQFTFETLAVRTLIRDGAPWFVLADVCAVLGIENSGNAASRLDDDEKGIHSVDTLGGKQNLIITNESGLWSIVLTSRKEKAKRFKKWLTSEVIPSIRKTGAYSLNNLSPAEMLVAQAQMLLEHERRMIAVEKQQAVTTQIARHALELATIAEAKSQATALACQDYSVMAYSNLCKLPVDLATAKQLGSRAAELSRERGLPIGKARDPRFGSVNTYMESILQEIFTEGL